MTERDKTSAGIIGFKGEGKTPYIMKLIMDSYDMRTARVLIICPTKPAAYEGLPIVQNLENLGKKGWRGIWLYVPNVPKKVWLKQLDQLSTDGVFKGGAVVFDDADRYFDKQIPEDLKACVLNHKNNGWDAFIISHSLIDFPSFLRRNVSSITLFKTADEFTSANDLQTYRYPNSSALFGAWKYLKTLPRVNGYIQTNYTIKTGV